MTARFNEQETRRAIEVYDEECEVIHAYEATHGDGTVYLMVEARICVYLKDGTPLTARIISEVTHQEEEVNS